MKSRREGLMGPMYGYQWRFFNATYDEQKGRGLDNQGLDNQGLDNQGLDQLSNVVNLIRKDPMSRRIVLTSFNPKQATEGVLYPCHSLMVQFYVNSNGNLDMFCYNRSQDLFLGTPFNIASSALLLVLIAKITNNKVGVLNMSLGDVHLYKSHYELAQMQKERQPYMFPLLKINKDVKELSDICEMTSEDFTLENYRSHPSIKGEMIA
jgi:thymidylate synthase